MVQSHGCAPAQNFPEFAQKYYMRKLNFFSFFFMVHTYYVILEVIFFSFFCAKFQNQSFYRTIFF